MEIWSQKYRPTELDNFVGQDSIVEAIRRGDMTHHIFYSKEPGVGKTTLARIISNMHDLQIHIFNASTKNMRGIEFIENEILPMSRLGNYQQLFLLDEADQLTPAAQSALKGVIENSQGYFILTCNDLSKITPWLQSRCRVSVFKPIPADIIIDRLKVIAANEGCDVSPEHINKIAEIHEGDLRASINALQALNGLDSDQRNKMINKMSESMAPNIPMFLRTCFRDKDLDEAMKYLDGYDIRKAIRDIFNYCMADSKAATKSKMKVINAAVTTERDIINGVDESILTYNFVRLLIPE